MVVAPPIQQPYKGVVNSCQDEIAAMKMFEANSTASARLTKIAYLKLYNRLVCRKTTQLLKSIYANRDVLAKLK